tara:strand:+ start:2382 stop:2810 length:429 start_codon:yes stop_codon:yes gene_type:complete
MTPEQLKTLIESDATAAAAATAEDWVACADRSGIIAPTIRVPVSSSDVRREASLDGVWATMVLASRESSLATDEVKGICVTFIDWIDHSSTLDFDLPQVQAMAAGLVAAGICTQAQYDDLSALGDQSQTFSALECRVAMRGA